MGNAPPAELFTMTLKDYDMAQIVGTTTYGKGIVQSIFRLIDGSGLKCINVEDGLRLERALGRERKQEHPAYAEMCRRFLADSADFSDENLRAQNISRFFENNDFDECLSEICRYIAEY